MNRHNVNPSINNDWSIKTIEDHVTYNHFINHRRGEAKLHQGEQGCYEWVQWWTHLPPIEPFSWIKSWKNKQTNKTTTLHPPHVSQSLLCLSCLMIGCFSLFILLYKTSNWKTSPVLWKIKKEKKFGKKTCLHPQSLNRTDGLHFDSLNEWNNSPTIVWLTLIV